jgi:RNA 2',3'-cyclic 3'-phosphodiesterase
VRLFIAVWPPALVVSRLAALDRPACPGFRWTTADQWHVTLRFLGTVAEDQLRGVEGALAPLGSEVPLGPVVAVAGPALVPLGPNVLCLPVAGLDGLADAVVARTLSVGAPVADRPFLGHLTMGRASRPARPSRASGGVDLGLAEPMLFAASWPVEEVTLVASTLRPSGASYQVIGRYPLG